MRTWHFSNFYFFYFATIGIIMPYWGLYLDYLGFSAKEIGQLMAIFLFTKMLAPNVWAVVADRLATSRGSSLSLLKFVTFGTLVVYLFLYVADGFVQVAIVMLSYCVFWNASLPQIEAATLNHLSDKRHYGRVRLWGSIGFIVTVTGLGLLMDYSGPSAILPAGGAAFALLFFASLLMRSSSSSSGRVEKPISVLQLLNWKVVVLLLLCLLMQFSHAPLQAFMSLYLLDYGYTNFQVGLLWSTGVVFEIMVFIFAYYILSRYRLHSLLTFTFLVAAVRWLLIGTFPHIPVIVFFTQAMHAITFGLYHAVMMQLIDRLFVGQYQIRGQALYSSITFGLGGAIGSFLSGYIWSDIGKQELFLLSGYLMLLVWLFSWRFTHRLTT